MAAASTPLEADGDLTLAESALGALNQAWEAAVDELGSAVPPAQLRAVLAIGAAAPLSISTLAGHLHASASATSRLCDRLQQAGLITRTAAAPDRRGVLLSLTSAGDRLAAWVRGRRRACLAEILTSMAPAARKALIDGLRELPSAAGQQAEAPPPSP
jgi:DNA-binding MarR family transcriptional regulator